MRDAQKQNDFDKKARLARENGKGVFHVETVKNDEKVTLKKPSPQNKNLQPQPGL